MAVARSCRTSGEDIGGAYRPRLRSPRAKAINVKSTAIVPRSDHAARRERLPSVPAAATIRRERIAAGQCFDDLTPVLRTLRGIVRKAAQNHPLDSGVEVANHFRRCSDLARRIALSLEQRSRTMSALAGEELVHHQAQRIEI